MAGGDRPRRLQRPRNRTLVLVAVALLFTTVFLRYVHLGPAPFTLSSPLGPNDRDTLKMDDEMTAKSKRTYPQIVDLPAELVPTAPSTPKDLPRRLIIVGDVHGHLKSLQALLRKAEFSAERGDTLVLAGDMVNKGPDSPGVVEFAMKIGAFAVRGNHEDRVLTAWQHYEKKNGKGASVNSNMDYEEDKTYDAEALLDVSESETANTHSSVEDSNSGDESDGIETTPENEENISHKREKKNKKGKKKGKKGKGKGKKKKSKDRKPRRSDLVTAQSLKPEHRAWLAKQPLILRIGDLGPRYGDVLVVHAGLVPGIPLESQRPDAVMTMRTLLPRSSSDSHADSHPDSYSDFHTSTTSGSNQEPLSADPPQQSENLKPGHKPMVPSAEHDGVPWAAIWTSYQTSLTTSQSQSQPQSQVRPTTVVYGHDAKAGLKMRRYAFGLDSGCARDRTLTGVVFEFTPASHNSQENNNNKGKEEQEKEEGEKKKVEVDGEGGEIDWDTDIDGSAEEQRVRARIRHRLVSVSCAEA
ncbi:Metallo-dependent phosphatase [Nemania sp. FL0031]|nr:Metallo-dependent phosphatase [Nemania sp. FL0031]